MIHDDIDERITRTAMMMRETATTNNMIISGDDRVSEADAAVLLGNAAGYLKQMRAEGRGPVAYRRGLGGARVSYRLDDLARWIEERRIFEPTAATVS